MPLSDAPREAPKAAPGLAGEAAHPGYLAVIVPRNEVPVAPTFGGIVAKVLVNLGDNVDKGDVVAQMDDRPIKEEINIAKQTLRSASAARSRARVDLAEAQRELAVVRKLVEGGAAGTVELESAQSAVNRAKADLEGAGANVQEQRARLDALKRQLDETRLLAPFSGRVAARYAGPGAKVQADQPVLKIITADDLWLRFAIPGGERGEIKVGDRLEVRLEQIASPLRATVENIAPELDSASQMIFAEATLDIPDELRARIQPGLKGRVRRGASP